MRRLFIILLFGFLSIKPQISMATEDYILFISSYSSEYPWSKAIEESFRDNLKQLNIPLEIYTEYLNTNILPATYNWTLPRMEMILESYKAYPPKIVILLSDEAWNAYRKSYKKEWYDVNVLLAGVKKQSLKLKKENQGQCLCQEDFIPTDELCKKYNATGIVEELQLKSTVSMMRQLQPELQGVAIIGDRLFYGVYTTLLAQKYLHQWFPDFQLFSLDGRFITTDSLYKKISTLPLHTGIILSGWHQDKLDYLFDTEMIYENICSLANRPIYVLNDWGLNNIKFIGGYYSTINNYGDELANLTNQIIKGIQAQTIPLKNDVKNQSAHLNQSMLRQYRLDPSNIQDKSINYYALLPTFWQKHAFLVSICGIIIGIGIILYVIILTSQKFKLYRRKLDNSQNEIDISLNNQEQLSDALRYFLEAETEQESVNKILKRLLDELQADRAYIFEFDDIHHTSSNTYEICSPIAAPQIDKLQKVPNEMIPWLYSRMQEDKLLVTEDLRTTQGIIPETERKILLEQGIISMLVAPLHVNNKLWGYVGIDYIHEIKYYGKQDVIYLKTLAQILCIGIEHFRSEKRNTLSQQRVAELESLFSFTSEKAHVGFAQWNPFTCTGFATDQWFINLGETTREISEVIGICQYMHPDDRKELHQFIASAANGSATTFEKNVRIQQDGEWRWYRYHSTLRNYDINQRYAEVVFLSVDIDNLKKIEANLIQAKARAEESDKLKSAFIANMSHEIRTPLNAIIGFSNLLAEDIDLTQEEKSEYIRLISTNNQLLLQLINDILDISKIEAGVMVFNEDIIELNQFCRELESIYILKATQEVTISFVCDHPEEYTLNIDRTRLSQVISNFLNNAIKFTQQGYIHFGYRIQEKMIYFYVTDTGSGIPQNKQKDIFHRFVKLNSFVQGTGLGLSICSTIVEKFGGEIGVESEPDQGSTFWFTIPRQDIGPNDIN